MKEILLTMVVENELSFLPLNFFNATVSPFPEKIEKKLNRKKAFCKAYNEIHYRIKIYYKPISMI
jgi:hypothetical protein